MTVGELIKLLRKIKNKKMRVVAIDSCESKREINNVVVSVGDVCGKNKRELIVFVLAEGDRGYL